MNLHAPHQPKLSIFFEIAIFSLFLLLHVILFNINVAEWGDSYRILRASEFIRNFSYPSDEKRPPLFSFILALHPANADQIFWGKLTMIFISIAAFFVFKKFCEQLKLSNTAKNLCLLLFALNPIYFYWSLRIYADVPLSLISLSVFLLSARWYSSMNLKKSFLLGFLCGLAVLTRFEGYLLFVSVIFGLFFLDGIKKLSQFYWVSLRQQIRLVLAAIFGFGVIILPYIYFRNPLTSTYFEEPSKRAYDLETVAIYFLSVLFGFGFVFALFFIIKSFEKTSVFYLQHPGVFMFVALELILTLVWPAAIPRLFVPTLPFIIIPIGICIDRYFSNTEKNSKRELLLLGALFGIYIIGQHFLRLQFLSPHRLGFLIIVGLQLPIFIFIYFKKFKLFIMSVFLSLFLWTIFTIWLHKDISYSIKSAASYTQSNLVGTVGYNDVGSITDWYLNFKNPHDEVAGMFLDMNDKTTLTSEFLAKHNIKYLIITNEHNSSLKIDLQKRPYLKLIKEFNYEHGGRLFWSRVVSVI